MRGLNDEVQNADPSESRCSMRIERIETFRPAEHPNLLWVRIHESGGLVGVGETFYLPAAVEAVIHDFAAPMLLGQSAFDRERHWQNLFCYANFFGYAGAEMPPISALDIALWDLFGQHTGQPIYNLLGGADRAMNPSLQHLRRHANVPRSNGVHQQAARARSVTVRQRHHTDEGLAVGPLCPTTQDRPDNRPGRMVRRRTCRTRPVAGATRRGFAYGIGDSRRGWRADADRDRGTFPLGFELRVADRPRIEPYDVVWMEDIIQPDSADDLARLVHDTARSPMRQRASLHPIRFSRGFGAWRGTCRDARSDLDGRTHGSREDRRARRHLSSSHRAHDCTGPINLIACLHLCAPAPNAMIMEIVRRVCSRLLHRSYSRRPSICRDGRIVLQFGPGLGTTLRPEVFDKQDMRRRVSEIERSVSKT